MGTPAGYIHSVPAMETRRKPLLVIASLAGAWMLAARAAHAMDGSEKVPTLPADMPAAIPGAWP